MINFALNLSKYNPLNSMTMSRFDAQEILLEEQIGTDSENFKSLILHNDDWHTFDYVIKTLIDICKHTHEQAEQCAWLVHHKGKCDVKSGTYQTLKPLKEALIERELIVSID
jgi:ATP-dependent Clp protease adaptor protein ClpS